MKLIFFYCLFLGVTIIAFAQEPTDSTCNCEETRKLTGLLNAESARVTVIPLFSPLVPLVTDVFAFNNRVNTTPSVNWMTGARFHYYAPNSILSFGSGFAYITRNITINDDNHIEFNSQEIEFNPYLNIKTGRFDKLLHFNIDAGVAYSRKLYSIVNYFTDYKHTQVKSGITNDDKLFATFGLGITRDIFKSDWHRIGLFSIGVTYFHPMSADFFSKVVNPNPVINNYRFYSSDWQYFTVSVGTHIFFGTNNNAYFGSLTATRKKRLSLIRTPNYFDEPEKNVFGGFNFSIGYQPALDTIQYRYLGDSLQHRFRSQYNYMVGYNLHFGKYKSKNNETNDSKFRYSIFAGPMISNRSFTIESNDNLRYHIFSVGANTGFRLGVNGIYLIGGTIIRYHLKNHFLIANQKQNSSGLFSAIDYSPYVGVGFRNLIHIAVQQNPIITMTTNSPSFVNGLEWRIGVGF